MTGPTRAMVAGSVGSWVAAAVGAPDVRTETLCGMLAPLFVAVASWELAERAFRTSPERLTALMITAFAGKMVFFGAYVALALWGMALRPVPFVVSFTVYFIVLHLVEALYLRRLFAGRVDGAR